MNKMKTEIIKLMLKNIKTVIRKKQESYPRLNSMAFVCICKCEQCKFGGKNTS